MTSSAQRRLPPPTYLHGQQWPLPRAQRGLAGSDLGCGFFLFFLKNLLSINNNRYHKETGFHIGQIDYLNRYNKYDRYYNRVLY
jgi:hypothetical protein